MNLTLNATTGLSSAGGGIANQGGEIIVNTSTFAENSTAGDTSHGGGFYNVEGNLTVRDSTISNNSVTGHSSVGGGGYSNTDLQGDHSTSIINSTISGNSSLSRGGGVYNADGLTEIKHSTVTENQTALGFGGGVASFGNADTSTAVLSTIISGNLANNSAGEADDVEFINGTFTNSFQSLGHNLIGSGIGISAFTAPGDQAGVNDPMLGPLAINGGTTQTHVVLEGSPAINAGDPGFDPNGFTPPMVTDQRGAVRVQAGQIDVGAVESPFLPRLAADFDSDGDVDGIDFLSWQLGFGTGPGATKAEGDANIDGFVDGLDLTVWQDGFGSTAADAVVAASSTVAAAGAPAETSALMAVRPLTSITANDSVESFAANALAPSIQSVSAAITTATPRQSISVALSSKLRAGLAGLTGETGRIVRAGLSQELGHGRAAWSQAERPQLQKTHRHFHDHLLADFAAGPPVHDRLLADEWIGTSRRLAREQTAGQAAEKSDSPLVEDLVFDILGSTGI